MNSVSQQALESVITGENETENTTVLAARAVDAEQDASPHRKIGARPKATIAPHLGNTTSAGVDAYDRHAVHEDVARSQSVHMPSISTRNELDILIGRHKRSVSEIHDEVETRRARAEQQITRIQQEAIEDEQRLMKIAMEHMRVVITLEGARDAMEQTNG